MRTEISLCFKCIGFNMNYKEDRYKQASHAMFGLLCVCRKIDLPVNVVLDVFEKPVKTLNWKVSVA